MAFALSLIVVLVATSLSEGAQRGAGRGRGQAARGQSVLPRGTAVYRDVEYVTNGHAHQRLDLYVPKTNSTVPLILFVHGGGYSRGDKADQDPSPFLADGYAFASLNYRLSGDATFPAQIQDCKAAVRWLRANAAGFKLDPGRFGAWGTSAGGHLVALLGTSGDTTIFDVGENLEFSSRVQAIADWFGPTDLLQMDAHRFPDSMSHNGPGSPESRLIGGAIQSNKEKVATANPISYITANDPPFLIAHGDQDRLVPHHQSELLHAALKASGVPVTLITVKGAGHGLRNAAADEKRKQFFKKYLK